MQEADYIEDNDDLARHVWEQYTTSKTDLTKARERLDSISARCTPVSPVKVTSAAASKVETTQESKTTSKVDVPENKKSKVLQLRQKPPLDLTGTASKESESVGSALTRIFGSKVLLVLTIYRIVLNPSSRLTLSW